MNRIKDVLKIPPKYTGYRNNLNIVKKLRQLEIGDSKKFPIDSWGTLHACAKSAQIKIATRTLGSDKEVTVWRIQ